MAGNSLDSLLAWMKEDTRMLGWGLVVAFERRKANLLIAQEYIRRFGAGSYLPAIKGEVPIIENQWMEYVHDFVLDVPRLSFENADLNDSKAMLTMAVMGGSQITLKKESVGWKANKVDEIDPLQGPKLYLDLLLNQVPGDVETDGRVKLDLSRSDNFRLTFGQTAHEQRMGGDFFKDLFNQLPDEQRIYPLGQIQRGTNELMNPKSFELRTQASSSAARDPRSAEYGEGAILALVRTMARSGGNFPGAGYKYLIPDDQGKDYSATVLFDRKRVAASVMIREMSTILNVSQSDFDYIHDDDKLLGVRSKSGGYHVESIDTPTGIDVGGTMYYLRLKADEFDIPASNQSALNIEVGSEEILVGWNAVSETQCQITSEDGSIVIYEGGLNFFSALSAQYEFFSDGNGEVSVRSTGFEWSSSAEYLNPPPAGEWDFLMRHIILSMQRYLNYVVSDPLESLFKATFKADMSINSVINETIQLNFGQAIQGNEIYAPADIGFFGRINPTQTSFVVSPMEPLLKQGESRKFTTEPAVAGVKWTVENLVASTGLSGEIDENTGEYVAPTTFEGRYTRVRVTATNPATGYFSSALVTVVANELTLNPLIQTCDVGATVELSAGQLGTDELTWSIKNPVPGESGEVRPSDKPEGDHTYHHGPVIANKTFVLDEIEVKSASGAARSVHVLALQKQPLLTVSIGSIDQVTGQVQLQAFFNGMAIDAEWNLPLGGPGSIDATGLYRAAPTATERFALVFALVDGGPLGKFEGYLILPLPLVEFPKLLEVLGQ